MLDVWGVPDYRRALLGLGLSPTSAESVARAWPSPRNLSAATVAQLRRHGLTTGQARRIVAAVDLARLANRRPESPSILGPAHVYNVVAPVLSVAEHEIMLLVMLDGRQQVIDVAAVSQGSTSAVNVAPGYVFRLAIRTAAASIILAHNHPSGDPEPSDADLTLTERMKDAGKLVGIPLVDHLVIARGGVCRSLADLGYL